MKKSARIFIVSPVTFPLLTTKGEATPPCACYNDIAPHPCCPQYVEQKQTDYLPWIVLWLELYFIKHPRVSTVPPGTENTYVFYLKLCRKISVVQYHKTVPLPMAIRSIAKNPTKVTNIANDYDRKVFSFHF